MNAEDSYYNEAVDFYIEKPGGWVFFPTQWAMNVRNKAALSNEDIALIMQQANTPFVYMQKPLNRDDIAYPTVQATCRYFDSPTPEKMDRLARLQIQVFEKSFSDFELFNYSTTEILSGFPANYYKASFSVRNESADIFYCLAQSWSVFYNNLAYTIGLSGSTENIDEYESDITDIVNSILIGHAS